jgi:hypothetical protein
MEATKQTSRHAEDLAHLEEFIPERLAAIGQERAQLLSVGRDLEAYAASLVSETCPVCEATAVVDLRALHALGQRTVDPRHGGPVIAPWWHRQGNAGAQPETAECLACYGFAVPPLSADAVVATWTRENISPRSRSLAAQLLQTFPDVEEVAYRIACGAEWHVRVGLSTWWCYLGPKAHILESLMLDRRHAERAIVSRALHGRR